MAGIFEAIEIKRKMFVEYEAAPSCKITSFAVGTL